MQFANDRILIFAKAPEPGKTKTRLIPALGAARAAEFYQELLESTVKRLAAAGFSSLHCCCTPDTDYPVFRRLSADYGVKLEIQVGKDLGERMEYAARKALIGADSVLLIGGDCPILESRHLVQALRWLQQGEDAVLGPAEDGGYVLLGLKQVNRALFQQIPWGGDRVLELTRQRLEMLGWRWRELEPLWDLDRPEDLERYGALARV